MLGLFPFAKTFECAKISLVMISWSCLYIPLYNTSWLVVARQLCYFITAQLRIQLLLPFLDNINVSFFFYITSKCRLHIKDHPFWGVRPPLNLPLFEVLFRRDTCIVLFPFKPKTLPFEDKLKMPLFSLQGYLKTEISLWWNTTGKDSVCSWTQFYSQMKSCVSHCEFLTWPCCENKSILILSWNRSELDFFPFYLFVQFQPLFW